ncbi:hypothetical protein TNCV_91961 [Trichonephila clavipes]|nr:hypothetical protein TNCV_91961 [Trichonephila clavipes]
MPPDWQRLDRGPRNSSWQRSRCDACRPTRRLAVRRLFRVPPCHEGTIHLQTSMSSPGFEPSPYGAAVSVANHYSGWVT